MNFYFLKPHLLRYYCCQENTHKHTNQWDLKAIIVQGFSKSMVYNILISWPDIRTLWLECMHTMYNIILNSVYCDLTLLKIAIWLSKNCQKLDICQWQFFEKKWKFLAIKKKIDSQMAIFRRVRSRVGGIYYYYTRPRRCLLVRHQLAVTTCWRDRGILSDSTVNGAVCKSHHYQ